MTTSDVVNTTETAARIHLRSVGRVLCFAVLSSCLGRGGMLHSSIHGFYVHRRPLPAVVRSFRVFGAEIPELTTLELWQCSPRYCLVKTYLYGKKVTLGLSAPTTSRIKSCSLRECRHRRVVNGLLTAKGAKDAKQNPVCSYGE